MGFGVSGQGLRIRGLGLGVLDTWFSRVAVKDLRGVHFP